MTSVGNRVLIIDDDEKLRKLLGEYLKDHGFHTTCRADGADVLGVLSTDSPDLVILDIMLPGKDGLEVLKEIRKDHGNKYCTADNSDTSLYLHCSLLSFLWAVAHTKNRIAPECEDSFADVQKSVR